MDVKIFLTADFANVDSSGKLNVLGAFSTINVIDFPATHMLMFVVAKLSFDWTEFGEKRDLNIKLHDPDGNEIAAIKHPFTVPQPKIGQMVEVNAVLGLRDVQFQGAGKHEFRLFIDKDLKEIITVEIVKIEQAAE